MSNTRISQHVNASRASVYRALLDPRAIATWKVPSGMTAHVHSFDAREGGSFRISLTYDEKTDAGKTTAHTDTYHGHFVKLVPDEQVVEVDEFETDDPALRGAMTVTITLADADGGTDLVAVHEGLPPGLSAADNEKGWRMALEKLAALVESSHDLFVPAFHGVRYQVADVRRAIRFYTEELGFKVERQQLPQFANVSLGPLHLLLSGPGASGSRPMADGSRQEPGGWNRVVLRVDDLPSCIKRMTGKGVRFRTEMQSGPGGRQIQLLDPDGNPVELFEPAPASRA